MTGCRGKSGPHPSVGQRRGGERRNAYPLTEKTKTKKTVPGLHPCPSLDFASPGQLGRTGTRRTPAPKHPPIDRLPNGVDSTRHPQPARPQLQSKPMDAHHRPAKRQQWAFSELAQRVRLLWWILWHDSLNFFGNSGERLVLLNKSPSRVIPCNVLILSNIKRWCGPVVSPDSNPFLTHLGSC
jgi:hypothetical protein